MKVLTGTDFYMPAGLYTPGTAIIQPAAYVSAAWHRRPVGQGGHL